MGGGKSPCLSGGVQNIILGDPLWVTISSCFGPLGRGIRSTICTPLGEKYVWQPPLAFSEARIILPHKTTWESAKVSHERVFALLTPEIHSYEMAQMLQKPVFAHPGCQRMSVNTLLCDTLALADYLLLLLSI